jgi:hypothetical protein
MAKKKTKAQKIRHNLFHSSNFLNRLTPFLFIFGFAAVATTILGFSDAQGSVDITVRARGTTGSERIELRLADNSVASWNLTSSYSNYTYSHSQSVASDELKVAFTNDGRTSSGADKNVLIDYVIVNGATFQSEGDSVLSTGTYTGSSGCDDGLKRSQWLHCNGYFQYAIGDAGRLTGGSSYPIVVRAKGDTGEERIELRIKGSAVASYNLTRNFQSFTHIQSESIGNKDVRVAFVNDGRTSSNADKNVTVDYVRVNDTTFQSEDSSVLSTGTYKSGTGCAAGNKESQKLHCNGYFEYSVGNAGTIGNNPPENLPEDPPEDTPEDPPVDPLPEDEMSVRIDVQARGTTGEETIELRIRDRRVAGWDLTNSFRSYSYTSPTSVDDLDIKVVFTNDGRTASGQDKNVDVDYIKVRSTTFQSESSSVFSSGSWESSTGCAPGYKRSQTLHCGNSFFHYSIGSTGLPGGNPPIDPSPEDPPEDPPTTGQPKAGHNGNVGCRSNCRNVGFQNLDGRTNFTLENVIISNPNGKCLSVNNARNITVRNVTIENCATSRALTGGYSNPLISVFNSQNVTFENNLFRNNARRDASPHRNNLIDLRDTPDFTMRNNEIRNLNSDINSGGGSDDQGNRVLLVRGNNNHNLTVEYNSYYNPGRNLIQITGSRSQRNVSFSHNRSQGRGPWNSDFEDMINLYSASGTPDSPIRIFGNYLRDGGPSRTGTGLIVGDGGNGIATEYVIVAENVMVNPGHVGINVAGGHNFTVRDNKIVGNVDVPHWTTVGFTVNHFQYTPECKNHVITGNRVNMRNQLQGGFNDSWIPGTCNNNVRFSNNIFGDRSLTEESIWDL